MNESRQRITAVYSTEVEKILKTSAKKKEKLKGNDVLSERGTQQGSPQQWAPSEKQYKE